jgi:hypothetical protein
MDEWQVEMSEIKRRLHELEQQKGDPVIIDELEAQLRILQSFYATAWRLFDAGEEDAGLRQEFERIGWGEWTFQNVYSYVYERAMEVEPGRRELSSLVPELDYAGMIHAGRA